MITRDAMLEHVSAWNDRGVSTIPVSYMGKQPLIKWKNWVGRCPPRPLVERWFSRWPCNLGLLLGNTPKSEGFLIVLDFDVMSQYIFWRHKNPSASHTYTVSTSRGRHVYFWLNDALQSTQKMPGGEIKATGIIVAPPSIHATGRQYSRLNGDQIARIDSLEEIGIKQNKTYENRNFEIIPTFGNGESTVSRIKNGISILGFLNRLTEIKKVDKDVYIAVCPFHDDHNPSMQIWPDEARCYCHAVDCRAHKRCDVIDCAELAYGLSNYEAICMLASEL